MSRLALIATGVLGALAVLFGAFGAHILRPILPPQSMTIYQTGIHYLQMHVLALLGTGLLMDRFPERGRGLKWVAWGFLAGCFLFSGSLIALAVTGLGWLGAVTPFGGVAWIAAWLGLALAFLRRHRV